LLIRRRPGHPVGWIFAAAGMLATADFASFEYALATVAGHRNLPAGEYAGWLQLPDTLRTRLYWMVAGSARGRTNMNGMRVTLEKMKAVVETAGRSR
jgi:hypothetical protein